MPQLPKDFGGLVGKIAVSLVRSMSSKTVAGLEDVNSSQPGGDGGSHMVLGGLLMADTSLRKLSHGVESRADQCQHPYSSLKERSYLSPFYLIGHSSVWEHVMDDAGGWRSKF